MQYKHLHPPTKGAFTDWLDGLVTPNQTEKATQQRQAVDPYTAQQQTLQQASSAAPAKAELTPKPEVIQREKKWSPQQISIPGGVSLEEHILNNWNELYESEEEKEPAQPFLPKAT